MAGLKLIFLGSPQVVHDGELLDIGASKAQALLVYLAVTGQSHSRDALGTLLWPDNDQSRARTYLRHALWTLKKKVGAEWLHISREQIGFQADEAVWLDVAAFREKVTAVATHNHTPGQMCPDCLEHLQEAVSLYRDNFLAGFTLTDSPAFDEWQFFQAEELRHMLAGTLEQLVEEYTVRQKYDAAITYARRQLSLDPLHEPAHRTLMQLYALDGQQAAALRQYQECVRLLDEELGIVAEAETTELYEAVRGRRLGPFLVTSAVEVPPPPSSDLTSIEFDDAVPVSTTLPEAPFVAREQELARLDEMLHMVLSGQPRIAFILGEAGQGKTALLQAFAQRAQEMYPGLIAVGGNCNAYTGLGDPYLPFREILALLTADLEAQSFVSVTDPEHALRIKRLLPETVRALVETAPDLIDTLIPLAGLLERTAVPSMTAKAWRQQLLAWTTTKSASPDKNLQQNALLDQYARLLQALARRVPLLLILDDLQWADPGSITLLFHLGRRLSGFPIFVVGAYRPDEVAMGQDAEPHPLVRVVHELQRLFGDILIDLGQAQGAAFIDAWLDNEPNQLEKFFRQVLYRQTGGHPLFTIELLRAMCERGDLQQDEAGIWQVNTNINWNTMPARVEGAIGERIQRLAPALQEMLQVASVEGEEFTAEVLASVLHLDERETVRLLSRDLDKVHALVRAIGTRRVGERRLSRYRFRHNLIQRYLYSLLDDVECTYQHEAVGIVLEELHKEQVTEVAVQLARHFEIAQLPEKAAVYLHLAGDQARRKAALQEAIRRYQAALAHWPDKDEAERASLLRKLGECQWMTGHANDALNTFETVYQVFEVLGNTEEAGAIQRLIGRVYWEVGNREKSLHHYNQALSILESLRDSVELAWAISSISQMHMLAHEHEQAIKWGERALTLARRLEAEGAIVHALNNIGISYLLKGQVEKGRAMLEESIQRAIEGNLPHDACRGYLNLGSGLTSLDHYEEARAAHEALYSYANEVHTILYATSSLIELARLDWLNGRWRSALVRDPQIQEWLERGQSMAYSHTIASELLSQQYNDLGQHQAAHTVLNDIWPTIRSFDELQFTGPYLIELVRSLSAQGKEAEAIQVIRDLLNVLARADYNRYYTIDACLFICDALTTSTPGNLLIDDVHTILDSLNQDDSTIPVPSLQATWHEAWGMVAMFRNEQGQAVDSLRRAVEMWNAVKRPYDQARAFKKLGETLVQAGKESEALDAFIQGNNRVEQLAAQLDDKETKAAFLQSPLVQAIQNGLQNLQA